MRLESVWNWIQKCKMCEREMGSIECQEIKGLVYKRLTIRVKLPFSTQIEFGWIQF